MTTANEPLNWPTSNVERLEREIGKRVHRISAGAALPTDASDLTQLMREHVDSMMPGVFARLRREGVLPKK